MARPLVLHIPHSSRHIPIEERERFVLCDTDIESELLKMTDAFTDELFPATEVEAGRVVHGVSRLLCDPERFHDDERELMAAKGMGALYLNTSTGQPLRTSIDEAERQRLLDLYYHPHHQRLESLIRQTLIAEGHCVVVDCHSFASTPHPHEPDQYPNRPDFCIGMDPYHTPEWLCEVAVHSVKKQGWSVQVDRPFAGALVPMTYYGKEKRVMGIMIEINRRLYMNETTGVQNAQFSHVVNDMKLLLHDIALSLKECLAETIQP